MSDFMTRIPKAIQIADLNDIREGTVARVILNGVGGGIPNKE
jgi:hypothetical protein